MRYLLLGGPRHGVLGDGDQDDPDYIYQNTVDHLAGPTRYYFHQWIWRVRFLFELHQELADLYEGKEVLIIGGV